MEVPTYSLFRDDIATGAYYHDSSLMTDEVLDLFNGEKIIASFRNYLINQNIEPMNRLIYVLEFLMIGVMWRVYGSRGSALSKYGGEALSRLYNLKHHGKRARVLIGRIKGIVNTAFLTHSVEPLSVLSVNVNQFARLIGWMKATGEFEQESNRLALWLHYFKSQSPSKSKSEILSAIRFAYWFEKRSQELLGKFTTNVDPYINRRWKELKWKENEVFCSRRRVEYHLNMVGAELMNRAFQYDFARKKEYRVLLPICMRKFGNDSCRAVRTEQGYACKGCAKDCQVNAIRKIGNDLNFQVYIIPHASTAFARERLHTGDVGIVGVACVLNLISGGYQAKALGYEPQCVILNHSGCAQHWHESGLVTSIDLDRLRAIMGSRIYS